MKRERLKRAIGGAVILVWALLAGGVAPAGAQDQVLNLRDADIRAFIDDVAMMTGRTFIVDPQVTGKVTVLSSQPVTNRDVMDIFMSTLSVHGYAAVPTASGVYKIVPDEEALQNAPSMGEGTAGSQYVTQVIRLHNVDPLPVLNMIKPLIHRQGSALASRGGDAVIVVDTAENLQRIRGIIGQLDKDTSVTRAIPLKNSSAQEMSKVVSGIIAKDEGDYPRQSVDVVPVAAGNMLLIKGEPETVEKLAGIVEELDAENTTKNDLKVIPLKHADAEQLVPILEKVSHSIGVGGEEGKANGRANIAFDKGTNSLIIAADPDMQVTLASVIDQLDRRRAQVLVEAIIVEVSDKAARELGLQWVLSGAEGSNVPFTAANYSNTAPNILAAAGALAVGRESSGDSAILDDLQSAAVNSLLGVNGFAAGAAGITDSGALFGVILTALDQDGGSNVLSTPSLMTLDNEEASIIVGQEIPITTGEALGNNNSNPFRTIDRKDVGVKLEVRPQINDGNTIKLFIRQEVSGIVGPVSIASSELVTSKREIETTVAADDGEIIVLGGLIENDEQLSIDKVPFLGDIPVLGNAFRSTARSQKRTNLMVFLRPTIVRGVKDMRGVTNRKYRYIRAEQLLRSDGKGTNLDGFMKDIMGTEPPVPPDAPEAAQ